MANKQDHDAETTPLLRHDSHPTPVSCVKPIYLVLLTGFLVSLSFGATQVPLIYAFQDMTCEAYYRTHAEPPSGSRRCSVPAVEAGAARAISLLGVSTTFFGVANLFITGWGIKRFGVKATLALQAFWPAARLMVQSIGVSVGAGNGIIIVQCSQIITIIGGPNGYMLALNTFVAEVTEHKERTGSLGRMQGCNMFGSAIGFLLGGVLAEVFKLITPFEVALGLFLTSTCYILLCLPYIPPKKQEVKAAGPSRLLGPLQTIMPKKWVLQDGHVQRQYGAIILSAGIFLAVLATGYIPTMLVMYAHDIFDFGSKSGSYMASSHLFLRGVFLVFVFPRLIKLGRSWTEKRTRLDASRMTSGTATPSERAQLANAMQDEQDQDIIPPKPAEEETFEFDLIYTRFSLLVDGVLTLGATFVSKGWHMYLIAALLPFGAGTASAAKGVILQMCSQAERTDALSAISFVEMMARLSTAFIFGLIYAAFANISKTYLVFICNAAVALVGFCILLFSRFPPAGSRRLEGKAAQDDESNEPHDAEAR